MSVSQQPPESANAPVGTETMEPDHQGYLPPGSDGDADVVHQNRLVLRWKLFKRSFKQNWSLFADSKIGLLGLAIIFVFALMGIAHPILMATVWEDAIYDPVIGYDAPQAEKTVVPDAELTDPQTEVALSSALLDNPLVQPGDTVIISEQPANPSSKHLLGTDPLGRDVLSQLLFGTRAAFAMGVIAAIVTVIFGTVLGSIAAYYGGWIDGAVMRTADLFLLIPLIPVLIFIGGLFKVGLFSLGLLIGVLSGLGPVAIVLKSQALSVKVKPFIDAAKVAGGSDFRIITRHIIPNVLPLSFLYMMFTVTAAIAGEATLSFFGLLEVDMSWGIMIHTAQTQGYLLRGTDFWWLLLPAGGAVTLLSAGFYLVGRGLDEVVNPRLRAR
ncbi:MAG: ABC transporter permease subunit [Nitriliruptorales bacterium]|nr:ABC transporter permease subunit [Nitriliruptorales bacterium]